MVAFMLLTSCNSEEAKVLTIGQCMVKESHIFKLFSQGDDDLILSSPQTEIMIYIKNSPASSMDRNWKMYTNLDRNYKIEEFTVGDEIKNGIVTKSVNKQNARTWIYIPIYPDTSIRIDYPDNANEQANRGTIVREFLKSISLKHTQVT
jgi:hypothetical protein